MRTDETEELAYAEYLKGEDWRQDIEAGGHQ